MEEALRSSGLFDSAALAEADTDVFPEQLLRNVAVAHRVAAGEHVAVVALVRETYASAVTDWAAGFLAVDGVITASATWEQLYALTDAQESLMDLRAYLADKSVNLSRAFKL